MSTFPSTADEPRRPQNPGDAWVFADSGERYWGRFGAAGLLALDAERGILLQHRVGWSHFGDTWALPGGARHEGESATDGALRESAEEAGVPAGACVPRFISVYDVDVWTYSTVVADVVTPFEPVISDPESRALRWVPIEEVADYSLHPGFAASWRQLEPLLSVRPAIIVDLANLIGSVPDGWWKDRAGATAQRLAQIAEWALSGMSGESLGLTEKLWYPQVVVVIEGQAREAHDEAGIEVVRASGSGDDAIVDTVRVMRDAGRPVTVVTSDRGLVERVEVLGSRTKSVTWLRDQL